MPWVSGQAVEAYGHAVVFYGSDRELAAGVGDYLGEGLRGGHAALVLATAAHRRAFGSGLAAAGLDLAAAHAAGRLITLDAATMLHRYLRDGRLDPVRFDAMTGALLTRLAEAGRPVRIYAEMVALLWDAGQAALALELEQLWNALAARQPFALLCCYPDRLLTDAASTDDVQRLRGLHISVTGADPAPGSAVRDFPQTPQAARQARRFVSGLLAPRGAGMFVADAEIVTGELAANAVLHARSAFTVTVTPTRAGVRIAVRDSAPLPSRSAGGLPAVRGHGLGVVAHLADRLAVQPVPGGKLVWAELSG